MSPAAVDAETARAIGIEAYTYLYPLVLMDLTRRGGQVGEGIGHGAADAFSHARELPPADFRDVVRPNFDTLYSIAWLDLHGPPRIVSVPETDIYYLLPLYDMWGEVFACPGTRTTGNGAGEFAIAGPGWSGELPAGVVRYEAPTPWVWVIGRTKASPDTYGRVHAFQDGISIAALDGPSAPARSVGPDLDGSPPPRQAFSLDAATYFAYAAELLQEHPPHAQDYPQLDRLARIGFRPGDSFDLAAAGPVVQAALAEAVPAARQRISGRQQQLGTPHDGWLLNSGAMGNFGTDYLRRACVELMGLGANLAEDAVYPMSYVDASGEPYSGGHAYRWHLDADALPPVDAFWSLTLYDAEGFQVANELNRFAIGDRDALEVGADGSLDILVQHAEPASGTANWLPAPEGGFNLCLRLYYPRQSVLDGEWAPPAVARIDTG